MKLIVNTDVPIQDVQLIDLLSEEPIDDCLRFVASIFKHIDDLSDLGEEAEKHFNKIRDDLNLFISENY